VSKVSRFEVILDEDEHMTEQVITLRSQDGENPTEIVSLPYSLGNGKRRIKRVYIVYTNSK